MATITQSLPAPKNPPKARKPETIRVSWDDQDASNAGWAWFVTNGDSGAIRGRQVRSQRPSLARVLRSVYGEHYRIARPAVTVTWEE